MDVNYPLLRFDLRHDDFVVWLRWVSLEQPPSPAVPPAQGMRVELQLNRNTVVGPTIVYRRELEGAPLYLRSNRGRVVEVLQAASARGLVDVQLIIHGSIANAPYAALFHVSGYSGGAIDTGVIDGTPMLQVQPSTPGNSWHVAGQANLRARLELHGSPLHLTVVR